MDSGYFLAVLQEVAMIWGNALAAFRMLVSTTLLAITRRSGISMVLAALCLCASPSLPAQTFSTLYLFGGGGSPDGGLVQGRDGNLCGVTAGGPGKEDGMIFKITPSGTVTTLHSGGGEYIGELVQGTDGNFYGTVLEGGTFNHG